MAHGGWAHRSRATGVLKDEMGTHTSLAPLYAYAPVGQRAFFEIPRNLKARTPRCLRAFTEEEWVLLWPWKERPPPECSRLSWSGC
jgi:hypothetical protein